MVRIGSNNHRTVRGYRSTDRRPKDCGLDAPVRTVPGRDPPEDARRCRTRYALESPAKRTGSRASHRSGRRAPVPCRRHLCGSLLALATMRPARSKPSPVLALIHRKTSGDRLWGTDHLAWVGAAVEGSEGACEATVGACRTRPREGRGGPSSAGAGHRWRDAVVARGSGAQTDLRPRNGTQPVKDRVELVLPRPCPR